VKTVVFARAFASDVQSRVRWLLAQDREEWAIRLGAEIEAAASLLNAAPRAGVVVRRDSAREMRRLVLRSLPFVLFYSLRGRKVVVLRLFHVRQSRAGH
jgi:plasmid stabilization system protein ParE